jgi:mono/diheme cytochrome c family protein
MQTRFPFSLLLSGLLLLMVACKHEPLVMPDPDPDPDPNTPCDSNLISFQEEILPIFLTNCAQSGCHGGNYPQEGIRLDNFQNIRATAGINFSNPRKSKILDDGILETDPDKQMPPPPNPRLSTAQIDKIIAWIQQGAKDTGCAKTVCDTVNVRYTTHVASVMNTYCVGCHNNQLASGNVRLNDYDAVRTYAINGRLLGAVGHKPGYVPMPQGGNKLQPCDIRKLQIWVDQGSPQ